MKRIFSLLLLSLGIVLPVAAQNACSHVYPFI